MYIDGPTCSIGMQDQQLSYTVCKKRYLNQKNQPAMSNIIEFETLLSKLGPR